MSEAKNYKEALQQPIFNTITKAAATLQVCQRSF